MNSITVVSSIELSSSSSPVVGVGVTFPKAKKNKKFPKTKHGLFCRKQLDNSKIRCEIQKQVGRFENKIDDSKISWTIIKKDGLFEKRMEGSQTI